MDERRLLGGNTNGASISTERERGKGMWEKKNWVDYPL